MSETEKILIFDGHCGFCRTCARWISRRWRDDPRPRAVAWQTIGVELPELSTPSREEMNQSVWWIDDKHRDAGARAIARALMAATPPWPVVGAALLRAPLSWGAHWIYRLVARYRHRLPGATAACRLPGPGA